MQGQQSKNLWTVVLKKSFEKQFKKLDKNYHPKIIAFLEALRTDIQPDNFDTLKMTGSKNEYRCRIGIYRILYNVFHEQIVIEVVEVGHRKDAYR
jgi:mRNA interferase RelE/StbE